MLNKIELVGFHLLLILKFQIDNLLGLIIEGNQMQKMYNYLKDMIVLELEAIRQEGAPKDGAVCFGVKLNWLGRNVLINAKNNLLQIGIYHTADYSKSMHMKIKTAVTQAVREFYHDEIPVSCFWNGRDGDTGISILYNVTAPTNLCRAIYNYNHKYNPNTRTNKVKLVKWSEWLLEAKSKIIWNAALSRIR